MNIQLTDENSAIRLIQQRLDSRNWWLIVQCSPESNNLAFAIESTFYDGHGDLFDMIIVCIPIMAIIMAHKSRMSMDQLCQLCHVPIEQFSSGRDVILTPDTPIDVVLWLEMKLRFDMSPERN